MLRGRPVRRIALDEVIGGQVPGHGAVGPTDHRIGQRAEVAIGGIEDVVWAQEEPRNMGARAHMSPRLLQILPSELEFGYIGRPERASPGEGYPAAHTIEQNLEVITLESPYLVAEERGWLETRTALRWSVDLPE